LIEEGKIYNGDKGGGILHSSSKSKSSIKENAKAYPYVLRESINNLYPTIADSVSKYMEENNIAWWGEGKKPTGNVLSSQISCINHLFPFSNNKDAVLSIIKELNDNFIDVLPIKCDKEPQYISFEVVSKVDHLNEVKNKSKQPTRGINCTSIDAIIYAKDKNGSLWLIPIEWKYTEAYSPNDLSKGESGKTRVKTYHNLIEKSNILKTESQSVYYFEPFYQLMRQTLWAEQMLLNKKTEELKADKVLHIHVIPKGNKSLIDKKYRFSGMNLVDTWTKQLKEQNYQVISPEDLLAPLFSNADGETKKLLEYLRTRYW
jgi:hypothetical protein